MGGHATGSRYWERRDALLQAAVHVGALLPLVVLLWDGMHGNLTVNPIQAITARTGRTALVLLLISLACTPASKIFRVKKAIRWRRPLGMYAFLYICLHFFTFAVLDYGLDLNQIGQTLFEKRYALVGLIASLLLVPLAITSTRGWMRRLGKNWRRLHWLVYPAAVLAILHWTWLVKADRRLPYLYGAILAVLLLMRIGPIKRALVTLTQQARGAISSAGLALLRAIFPSRGVHGSR
jgi:sulfoxide reductase heme-binding subunit YedZ